MESVILTLKDDARIKVTRQDNDTYEIEIKDGDYLNHFYIKRKDFANIVNLLHITHD